MTTPGFFEALVLTAPCTTVRTVAASRKVRNLGGSGSLWVNGLLQHPNQSFQVVIGAGNAVASVNGATAKAIIAPPRKQMQVQMREGVPVYLVVELVGP